MNNLHAHKFPFFQLICKLVFCAAVTFHAHAAEPKAADALGLNPIGSDSTSKTLVFNQRLSLPQIQRQRQAQRTGQYDPAIFYFLTDHGDNDRILLGIGGEQFELKRADTRSPLGRGGPYLQSSTAVSVRRGISRLKIIHPGPAACEDGYLESTEYFDSTVRIRHQGRTIKLNTTMEKQGCTSVPTLALRMPPEPAPKPEISPMPEPHGALPANSLPADVAAFIWRRDGCDHFRSEEAYDAERKKDLAFQMRKLCTGTDGMLYDLKLKYAAQRPILDKLNTYEPHIEDMRCNSPRCRPLERAVE